VRVIEIWEGPTVSFKFLPDFEMKPNPSVSTVRPEVLGFEKVRSYNLAQILYSQF